MLLKVSFDVRQRILRFSASVCELAKLMRLCRHLRELMLLPSTWYGSVVDLVHRSMSDVAATLWAKRWSCVSSVYLKINIDLADYFPSLQHHILERSWQLGEGPNLSPADRWMSVRSVSFMISKEPIGSYALMRFDTGNCDTVNLPTLYIGWTTYSCLNSLRHEVEDILPTINQSCVTLFPSSPRSENLRCEYAGDEVGAISLHLDSLHEEIRCRIFRESRGSAMFDFTSTRVDSLNRHRCSVQLSSHQKLIQCPPRADLSRLRLLVLAVKNRSQCSLPDVILEDEHVLCASRGE